MMQNMTCEFSLSDFDKDIKQRIMNDLIFEQTISSNGSNTKIKKVYAYHVTKDKKIILPKYYCQSILNVPIEKKNYEKIENEFYGELYPEQVESRNECINLLNKYKSCILSLPVGCGKCLDPETQVLQYDGTIKYAREIQRGDVLVGDDQKPRVVLSTVTGIDEMYTITNSEYNVNYTVNSAHILTVIDVVTHTVCDISLKWLLEYPELVGIRYKGFRISVDLLGNKNRCDRMKFINNIFRQYKQYTTDNVILKNTILHIGYSLGLSLRCKHVDNNYIITIQNGMADIYPFVIKKKQDIGKYCGFEIDGNGRFLLGDFTVTHNTATTINLTTKVNLKVLVIVNRLVLIKQWKEAIHQFCPGATIHLLQTKDVKKDIPTHFDFYIINAINVYKFTREQLSFIGFCIVDECHLIMSEVLSQCMWRLQPKYLIGLSASPYRLDGLDKMMQVYFGPNKVVKEIERHHIAYKVCTNLKPELTMTRFGKLDWNALINTISNDTNRNQLIINIVKKYPERYFLLLTKRIEQANTLASLLDKENILHDKLYGIHVYIKSDKHVLIGTTGKCGVGFDAPKLDTLIVCCDMVNYYIQMLGRVMRNKSTKAWVFDLVDDNPTLLKHYYERCKVYKKNGGVIERLDASYFDEPTATTTSCSELEHHDAEEPNVAV